MWILPNNHPLWSLFAQATGESNSVLNECLENSPLSLLWRSKPSQSTTWSRRWRRDSWFQRLCSRMLKPSLHDSFADSWTSLLRGSPASLSRQPGSVEPMMTHGTCSPTSSGQSTTCDPDSSCSKMSRESSQPNSRGTDGPTPKERLFCSMSSENWKDWVTEQRQEYSVRLKSEHPTNGSGSLSWRSPTHQEAGARVETLFTKGGQPARPGQRAYRKQPDGKVVLQSQTINQQVLMWPTVAASEARQGFQDRTRGKKGSQESLSTVVVKRGRADQENSSTDGSHRESWPTTSAGSANGGQGLGLAVGSVNRNKLKKCCPEGEAMMNPSKLNPRWVETLMGLPIGWVMPTCSQPVTTESMSCDCSATESCRQPPSELSESCPNDSPPLPNWLTPRAVEPNEPPGAVAARLGDRGEHCHGSLTGQVSALWATPRAGKTSGENPETWRRRQAEGGVSTMPLTTQVLEFLL